MYMDLGVGFQQELQKILMCGREGCLKQRYSLLRAELWARLVPHKYAWLVLMGD